MATNLGLDDTVVVLDQAIYAKAWKLHGNTKKSSEALSYEWEHFTSHVSLLP